LELTGDVSRTSISKMTHMSIIETSHGCFSWRITSFVIGCCLCLQWKGRTCTRIRASNSKVPLFFTIIEFFVRWGLDCILIGQGWGRVSTKVWHWSQSHPLCWSPLLALIGALEGKVTSLSTIEANLDKLGLRGWRWICGPYRSVRLTWIATFNGKVVVLSTIVACLGNWNLWRTLISLCLLRTLIFNICSLKIAWVLDLWGWRDDNHWPSWWRPLI
jgi:hypothetical protein